jgi:hypothetical protein
MQQVGSTMSVIEIRLDRINGTALQLFTGRTDEPRASIVADILVNDELSSAQLSRMDTMATAAGAVVLGYERLRHARPDIDRMVRDVSVDVRDVQRAVDAILRAVGTTVDADELRDLRLEIRACERLRDRQTQEETDSKRVPTRLARHLPPRFDPLRAGEPSPAVTLDDLESHIDRRYGDLFSLVLGPELYQRTAPDRLPEAELRLAVYGPSLGPGLELPD